MKKLYHLTLVLAMFIVASSCHKPECNNTNPVFNRFSPDASLYKSELAKQIQHVAGRDLSYWFENYVVKGGREYIIVSIRGADLCAKGDIQVNNWTKIADMRKESSGYRGAELKGLKIKIDHDSTGLTFVYQDIDRIID